jgi:hypothetical protein
MTRFDALRYELDGWERLQRRATLWLRDDDACSDTPALRRLLGIAGEHRVPVAIAAIPATADSSLEAAIASCREATVVQHGYAHRNHARPGERSAELGDERDVPTMQGELGRGRERLARVFGPRFRPVLVPPWNRIGGALSPHLPAAGYAGLSCFGPRASQSPITGIVQVNTHVDPIAWRRERAFIGEDAATGRLTAHLCARRKRICDGDEPTGLLTHHLVFTDAMWDFVGELMQCTQDHGAAVWLDVDTAFGLRASPVTSCRSA